MTQAVSLDTPFVSDQRASRTTAPVSAPSIWFWVILGGLPVIYPLVWLLGEAELAATQPIYWYFWVNAIVSAPHVYATYLRLQRKISEGRVHPMWGLPGYLICTALLGIFAACGYFVAAMTAVNLVQTYHYLRQVYGIQRLTTREFPRSNRSELLLSLAYHLPMPLFVLGRWNMLAVLWREPSPYIIPVPVSDAILGGCAVAAFVGLLCGIAGELERTSHLRSRSTSDPYAAAGWVQLVLYFVIHWYGFLSIENYQRGFFLITIFHAVQYLSVVWLFEKKSLSERAPFLRALSFEQSLLLFWAVACAGAYGIEQQLLSHLGVLWPMLATIMLSAVSAHHYLVDAVIWRQGVRP